MSLYHPVFFVSSAQFCQTEVRQRTTSLAHLCQLLVTESQSWDGFLLFYSVLFFLSLRESKAETMCPMNFLLSILPTLLLLFLDNFDTKDLFSITKSYHRFNHDMYLIVCYFLNVLGTTYSEVLGTTGHLILNLLPFTDFRGAMLSWSFFRFSDLFLSVSLLAFMLQPALCWHIPVHATAGHA